MIERGLERAVMWGFVFQTANSNGGYQPLPIASGDPNSGAAAAYVLLSIASVAGLVASPLFQTIEIPEMFYGATMVLPLVCAGFVRDARTTPKDSIVLVLLGAYFVAILLSSIVGALNGGQVSSIFRSIGPLLLPVFVWFVLFRSASVNLLKIGFISFVVAGVCQSFYIYYLYLTNVAVSLPVDGVVARVTYFDLRPVQPYLLIALAAGAALIVRAERVRDSLIGLGLFSIALAAVLFTQTRTFMVISAVLLPAALALTIWSNRVPRAVKRQALTRLAMVALGMFVVGVVLLATGAGGDLLDSIMGRFGSSMDRDDWSAAVKTFDVASVGTILFGVGIGSTFDVYGQQVSFVHNGFIYHLLFSGVVGLIAYTAFVGYVGYQLMRGFLRNGSAILLAIFLAYASLIIYTITFAIYKWPTYNTMIGFFAVVAASLAHGETKAPH